MRRIPTLARGATLLLSWTVCAPPLAAQQPVTLNRTQLKRLLDPKLAVAPVAVVGAARTDTVADTAARVRVNPKQYLATIRDTIVRADTAGGRTRLELPIRYVRPDANARPSLSLSPAIELEGGGLHYVPEEKHFAGSFLIGLDDSVQPGTRRDLDPPIRLQFTSDAGPVEPHELVLRHTNIPFERVRLESDGHHRDAVTVHVRPEFDPRGVSFPVALHRPELTLVAPAHIQGFGLEAAPLTVIVPSEAPAEARVVALEATRGALEPTTIVVLEQVGSAVLRSRGLGTATVTASSASGQLGSDSAEIQFDPPFAFLGAALIGAALGTVIARGRAKRRAQATSLVRSGAEAVSGLATGLLTAIAYAAGINLLGVNVEVHFGEAAVLVLAALGATYGLPGLEKIVPVVRRLSGAHPTPHA